MRWVIVPLMVGHWDHKVQPLNMVCLENGHNCDTPGACYEPELHPAVCYRIKSLRATLQIFSTGSITVTGPNVKAVATAVEQVYPFVFESRKEIL
ncbi:TATA box-binding protein-like protein 1, partial [Eschrichtius robustus]|nr:TATA box-binding protein-like protein 1 [Eschrichtius robustus]